MSSPREPYIVIAGSPRSGTTLLRSLLKGSSELVVHQQEPHYVLALEERFGRTIRDVGAAVELMVAHPKFPARRIDADRVRETFKGKSSVSLSELLRTCYRMMRGDRPEAPVVLKHPAFVLHMDLMRDLFPDLRVIQIIRDPRGNAFSQRTRWPSTSVWMSSTGWQSYIDAGQALKQKGTPPYLEVRYEDLLKAPEEYFRRICDFLGIQFESRMLAVEHVQKDWDPSNPGQGTKRKYQGLEKDRVDKWRKFMTPAEIKLIETQCRRGMALHGYESTRPAVPAGEYLAFYLKERQRALKKMYWRLSKRWGRR